MKKVRYLAVNNLPPRLFLQTGLVWWLALDHFGAPDWLYGALGVVWTCMFAANLVALWKGEAVDLLGNDPVEASGAGAPWGRK